MDLFSAMDVEPSIRTINEGMSQSVVYMSTQSPGCNGELVPELKLPAATNIFHQLKPPCLLPIFKNILVFILFPMKEFSPVILDVFDLPNAIVKNGEGRKTNSAKSL